MSFNVQETVYDAARYEAVKLQIKDYSPDLLGLQEDKSTTWGKSENFTLDGYKCYKDDSIESGERLAIYVKEGLTVKTSGSVYLTATNGTRALTYDDLKAGGKYALSTELFNQLKELGSGATDEVAMVNKALQSGTVFKNTSTSQISLLERRHMSYVVVEKEGQEILYVNMHLQHRSQNDKYSNSADNVSKNDRYELVQTVRSYERMKSFELAQAKIEALLQTYPNAEVVITGDFNDTKAGAIRDFCGGAADADGVYDVAIDAGYHDAALNAKTNGGNLTTTWNSYFTNSKEGQAKEVTNKTPLGSTAGTDGRIDFCFVSDGVSVNCYQTGAPYGKAGENGRQYYLSDHLSLIVDIAF